VDGAVNQYPAEQEGEVVAEEDQSEEGDREMMPHVQKEQWPVIQDDEEGVQVLIVLAEIKAYGPEEEPFAIDLVIHRTNQPVGAYRRQENREGLEDGEDSHRQ